MQIKTLTFLILFGIAIWGCSNSDYQNVAGKYSRTASYRSPDGKTSWSYTNTTQLNPDRTYIHSTNRGGKHKVLETGTYEIDGNIIIFAAKTGPNRGMITKSKFDAKAIGTDTHSRRVKE
jgi:hypothetical protein